MFVLRVPRRLRVLWLAYGGGWGAPEGGLQPPRAGGTGSRSRHDLTDGAGKAVVIQGPSRPQFSWVEPSLVSPRARTVARACEPVSRKAGRVEVAELNRSGPMSECFVGIDVATTHLDIAGPPAAEQWRVTND